MNFNLEKNWHKFIVFGMVGFIAFIVDWIIFNSVYFFSSFFLLSISLAWLFSMTFNFVINRNYTFNAKGRNVGKQLSKWLIIHAFAFGARVTTGKGILFLLGPGLFNANVAFFSGLMISIPTTFFGSLLWAFKKEKIVSNDTLII